jgi:hypothetical protein
VRRLALALLVGLAVPVGACGDDDSANETTPQPEVRRVETVDKLPRLPDGWKRYENRRGGFVVGLPPGWKAEGHDTTALIRSYDRLVAISISPDRGEDAFAVDLDSFTTRTMAALPGLDPSAQPSAPKPYEHHYEAVRSTVEAKETESGVEQRVSVITIRRDHLVTFTVVVAANAAKRARASERLAQKVVATLRSRPPAAG